MKSEKEDIRDREILRQERINAISNGRNGTTALDHNSSLGSDIKEAVENDDKEMLNKEEIIRKERERLDAIKNAINEVKIIKSNHSLEYATHVTLIEKQWLKVLNLIEESKREISNENKELLDSVKFSGEDHILITSYLRDICIVKLQGPETPKKHLQVVQYLFEKGIQIQDLTELNRLHIINNAISSQQPLIVKYLIEEGIGIDLEYGSSQYYFRSSNPLERFIYSFTNNHDVTEEDKEILKYS